MSKNLLFILGLVVLAQATYLKKSEAHNHLAAEMEQSYPPVERFYKSLNCNLDGAKPCQITFNATDSSGETQTYLSFLICNGDDFGFYDTLKPGLKITEYVTKGSGCSKCTVTAYDKVHFAGNSLSWPAKTLSSSFSKNGWATKLASLKTVCTE